MKRLLIIALTVLYLAAINGFDSLIIDKKAANLDSKLESLYILAENENP